MKIYYGIFVQDVPFLRRKSKLFNEIDMNVLISFYDIEVKKNRKINIIEELEKCTESQKNIQ